MTAPDLERMSLKLNAHLTALREMKEQIAAHTPTTPEGRDVKNVVIDQLDRAMHHIRMTDLDIMDLV